jgi:microsomal dipeptidase-like Zn-dependent dipeptidase
VRSSARDRPSYQTIREGNVKRILLGLAAVFIVAVAAAFAFGPGYLERSFNQVLPHEAYEISARAKSLHDDLLIADLHADTLLWQRDPLADAARGHVDVPRLVRGNVAVQVFAAVTKVPQGLNYDENTADSDQITGAAILQRWPIATWNSLFERARYQASRLDRAAQADPAALKVIRTRVDLDAVLEQRANGNSIVGGLLATEGLHPLEGEIDNITRLQALGYRMMGLHHFFDNALGGSLHGVGQGGLTEFGRQVVAELERRNIMIDVAHSSAAVVEDVLAMIRSPLWVSHTGVKGACDSARNLSDALMQRIAATGGVIGIGYWDGAVCDPAPRSVVAAMRYAVDLLGVDHVGLGSDYDGATTVTFDTAELAVLTEEMLAAGFTEVEIRAVMGGNVIRLLRERLPESQGQE